MPKESEVNFRVAVGTPDGPRSSVWRGYSTKSEVYLSHAGLGGIQKFSFHSSGICRLAFTDEEGSAEGEADRVIQRWKRPPAPVGDLIVYALIVRFPTDYLSTALSAEPKKVTWIPPAPQGRATAFDFVFTRAGMRAVNAIARAGKRTIFSHTVLPSGEAFLASWAHQDWIGGEDFTIPGALSPEKEFVASVDDPDNTGRPARVTRFLEPNEKRPTMIADEFGAYGVALGTKFSKPMGTLTRTKILKQGKKKKKARKIV